MHVLCLSEVTIEFSLETCMFWLETFVWHKNRFLYVQLSVRLNSQQILLVSWGLVGITSRKKKLETCDNIGRCMAIHCHSLLSKWKFSIWSRNIHFMRSSIELCCIIEYWMAENDFSGSVHFNIWIVFVLTGISNLTPNYIEWLPLHRGIWVLHLFYFLVIHWYLLFAPDSFITALFPKVCGMRGFGKCWLDATALE